MDGTEVRCGATSICEYGRETGECAAPDGEDSETGVVCTAFSSLNTTAPIQKKSPRRAQDMEEVGSQDAESTNRFKAHTHNPKALDLVFELDLPNALDITYLTLSFRIHQHAA